MVDRCWFSSDLRKIAVFLDCSKVNRTSSWDVHTTFVCGLDFAGETQGLRLPHPVKLLQRSVDVQPSCTTSSLCHDVHMAAMASHYLILHYPSNRLWRPSDITRGYTFWKSLQPTLPEHLGAGAFQIFHGRSPHIGWWSHASCVLMSDILASKKQQLVVCCFCWLRYSVGSKSSWLDQKHILVTACSVPIIVPRQPT